MKKTTRTLRKQKLATTGRTLSMLTCYDFQTAQMLDETELDMILVGDSLGNVVLGHETTVSVTLEHMKVFGEAVKRGAPNTFTVVDLPFGTYASPELAISSMVELFQFTKADALKLEGAGEVHLECVRIAKQTGIPVMGHIGLIPQSVHEMGGYFMHGKQESEYQFYIDQALALEKAGAFAIVLECMSAELASQITNSIQIPTIGIGSGKGVDGQVLVINDLLGQGKTPPPSFCKPVVNTYLQRQELVQTYLQDLQS